MVVLLTKGDHVDLLSEYKELYYKEIEHSERLNNRVSNGITVLPILGGTVIYAWTQLLDYDISWQTVLLIVGCCFITFLFIISFALLLENLLINQSSNNHVGNTVCLILIATLTIPLALLWIQLTSDSSVWYLKLYIVECCVSTYMFVICFIFFIRAYTGYKINYFPVRDMAKGIQGIHDENGVMPFSENNDVDSIVSAYLAQRFINDAIHNRKVNVQKSQRQFQLIILIIITFFAVFITLTTVLAINLYQAKAVQ